MGSGSAPDKAIEGCMGDPKQWPSKHVYIFFPLVVGD